jgi:hypothetical protein
VYASAAAATCWGVGWPSTTTRGVSSAITAMLRPLPRSSTSTRAPTRVGPSGACASTRTMACVSTVELFFPGRISTSSVHSSTVTPALRVRGLVRPSRSPSGSSRRRALTSSSTV